jgi:serine/threonine protein phosphatase PrpC
MKIRFSGRTDTGRKRPFNEDSFFCAGLSGPDPVPEPWVLLAVADGIGGHAAGEVASSMAVEILEKDISRQWAAGGPAALDGKVLEDSFLRANREIYQKASRTAELGGMGTTLAAALLDGRRSVAANVGDSRIYRIRKDELLQISRDHSWAAEQRRGRGLTAEDISRSPFRNMVTRSIGYTETILVDKFALDLRPGDGVLLCTDGLHGSLSDPEILKIICKIGDPEETAAALIKAANKAGGRDNITAIVARID